MRSNRQIWKAWRSLSRHCIRLQGLVIPCVRHLDRHFHKKISLWAQSEQGWGHILSTWHGYHDLDWANLLLTSDEVWISIWIRIWRLWHVHCVQLHWLASGRLVPMAIHPEVLQRARRSFNSAQVWRSEEEWKRRLWVNINHQVCNLKIKRSFRIHFKSLVGNLHLYHGNYDRSCYLLCHTRQWGEYRGF